MVIKENTVPTTKKIELNNRLTETKLGVENSKSAFSNP